MPSIAPPVPQNLAKSELLHSATTLVTTVPVQVVLAFQAVLHAVATHNPSAVAHKPVPAPTVRVPDPVIGPPPIPVPVAIDSLLYHHY